MRPRERLSVTNSILPSRDGSENQSCRDNPNKHEMKRQKTDGSEQLPLGNIQVFLMKRVHVHMCVFLMKPQHSRLLLNFFFNVAELEGWNLVTEEI